MASSGEATVVRTCTLDGFAATVAQAEGLDLTRLSPITRLLVRTENSLYRITVRCPSLRTVLVQGGSFFPHSRSGCLNGSSLGGSLLKVAWIGVGLHMEFFVDGLRIVTSRVRSIAVEEDATLPGPF